MLDDARKDHGRKEQGHGNDECSNGNEWKMSKMQ